MPEYKFAVADCAVGTPDGVTFRLREGEPWAADDPFVVSRPELFSDTPPGPQFPRRTVRAVEQATKAPAERRTTRRG